MLLSAQTHFNQGWNKNLITDIASLHADMIRDGIGWNQVEQTRGKFDFGQPSLGWVAKALAAGIAVQLVFQPNNDRYDGGNTVYTDAGRAAFANYVVATLKAFPGVKSIEIGNEFNGNDFVSGPVALASKDLRDDYYAKIVAAVDKAIDAAGIHVELVGGSTHSIPVDYFADLSANGALSHLDAVSIHPYTTPPEQLAAQLGLLRKAIGADKAIEVTEFGAKFDSLSEAPAYLAKMVAVMAGAGVASANWYAFASQKWFPNMELWDQSADKATPAGVTFKLLEDMLAGDAAVTRVEAGSATYFYTFGNDSAILWGEARGVKLGAGVTAWDLAGRKLTSLSQLSPDVPVILRLAGGTIADKVSFGQSALLADSFHDFDLTGSGGPWTYFAESGTGKLLDLDTMGGGLGGGEAWTPYLGLDALRPFSINGEKVVAVDFTPGKARGNTEFQTVERYTASENGKVTIRGHWDVADQTDDGVVLTIQINDKAIFSKVIFNAANGHVFDLELTGITLHKGDELDFQIGNRSNAQGDVTTRRIQIFDEGLLKGSAATPAGLAGTGLGAAQDLTGTGGRDVLTGTATGEVLRGLGGADKLDGLGGDDRLYGGDHNDQLLGGAGNDLLGGGAGNDMLSGGSGADIFVFEGHFGQDTVRDFAAGDRIDVSAIAGIDSFADLAITYAGRNAVIAIGDDQIILKGVTHGMLHAADFIL